MSTEDVNTSALDPKELQALLSDDWQLPAANAGSVVDKIEDHLPSPSAIRAVALATATVFAAAIGRSVDITPWLDAALSAYTIVVPFGLSLWLGKKAVAAKSATAPPAT